MVTVLENKVFQKLDVSCIVLLISKRSSLLLTQKIDIENQNYATDTSKWKICSFLTFPADFWIPIIFSNLNYNCSIFWDLRNLQEQVKKAFCYQKLFWPFTAWINCSSDLKNFANSWPSASNFKSFSWSLEQFFLTVGQNNFGNKIQFFILNYQNICEYPNSYLSLLPPNRCVGGSEFLIEELGNQSYDYSDLGCNDWPMETVMEKVVEHFNLGPF